MKCLSYYLVLQHIDIFFTLLMLLDTFKFDKGTGNVNADIIISVLVWDVPDRTFDLCKTYVDSSRHKTTK